MSSNSHDLSLPRVAKALVVQKAAPSESRDSKGYPFDAVLEKKPIPELKPNQVLVKITAAAFNHKDVWLRKGMYPMITVGSVYGADGAGIVVASATPNDDLLNKRVFLNPTRGWKSDPEAPESAFSILGGTPVGGTFIDYIVYERDLLISSPEHLDDVHVAALPVGGVTAWRAVVVNAQVQAGQNVLITGIGGGVALFALQFCLALGANVYVTSGSKEKIQKAVALGAKGGANYKDETWPAQINTLLQRDGKSDGLKTPVLLDAIVDSGGGDLFGQVGKYLKLGGRLVCYGMTASPAIPFTMKQVLANQKLIGSTMGSQKDLEDAAAFISRHRIVPVISQVLDGIESAGEGFELIARGEQFGKVVIKLRQQQRESKL